MAKRKKSRVNADPVLKALDDLKRLQIVGLIAAGVQATSIAKALGVHKSAVSKMVPARGLKLGNH